MILLLRLMMAAVLMRQHRVLLAEIEYLKGERDFYRDLAADRRRVFNPEWRRRFAEAGYALWWRRLAEIATVAKVSTIKRWHRLLSAGKALTAK